MKRHVVCIVIALLCASVPNPLADELGDYNSLWDTDKSTPPPLSPIIMPKKPAVIDGTLAFGITVDSTTGRPELLVVPDKDVHTPFALAVRTIDSALYYTLRVPDPAERCRPPEFVPPSESFLIHVTYPEAAGRDKTATFLAGKLEDDSWQLRALKETGFAKLYELR